MSGRYHRVPIKESRVAPEIRAAGYAVTRGYNSEVGWKLPGLSRTDDMQLLHPVDMDRFVSIEDVEAWYEHSPQPVVYALANKALRFSSLLWFQETRTLPITAPDAITEVSLRIYEDSELALPFARTAHDDFLRGDNGLLTPLWTSVDPDSNEEIEIFNRLGYAPTDTPEDGRIIMVRE